MTLSCWWTMTQAYEELHGIKPMYELLHERCQRRTEWEYIARKGEKGLDPITFPFCDEHYHMFREWQKKKGY